MFQEDFDEAWRQKYGEESADPVSELAPFLRHRSIRKYSSREVPESLVKALVAAAQSSATSSNLQLWSIVSVQESERREAIARLCGDQDQVRECAWFFAFIADHHRLRQAAAKVGEAAEGLDYVEFYSMAVIDAALAAERMVCAAESAGLGICYIGALRNDPPGVKELLNLPDHTFGVFGLCIGWPAEPIRSRIKPKLPQRAIWFKEQYDQDVDLAEYDERMSAFYESQSMQGDVNWSMRSGRRVDNNHLTGREVLKEWLLSQGFIKR